MEAHLTECGACRYELEQLRMAGGEEEIPRDNVLSGVLKGMEQWEAAPGRDAAVKAGVLSDLAPFLGLHASTELLASVTGRGENLLSTVEPVLALFLGCRAASTLVDQIVTHSMSRAG